MVGAAVLIALGVIFIPALLDGAGDEKKYPPIPHAPPAPEMPEPIALNTTPIVLKSSQSVADSEEPVNQKTEPVTAGVDTGDLSAWVVQLGSFTDKNNAQELIKTLRKDGYTAYIEELNSSGSISHRVRIGPEMTRKKADHIRQRIAKKYVPF